MSVLENISPLWALVPLGLLYFLSLMRIPYDECQRRLADADDPKTEREATEEGGAVRGGVSVDLPCACGSWEFRFTEGLYAREKVGFRAVCMGCFQDLRWRALGEEAQDGTKETGY